MICSSSCSGSRRWRPVVAAALLAAVAGCRHAPAEGPPPLRIAVFPIQNATGGVAPARALTEALDAALAERVLDVVPRKELDTVLAAHRIRYTGGVDGATAKVLREELAVDAVLVPTLDLYSAETPPKISLGLRLVGVEERPKVHWAGALSRSGDDSPGLLALGVITKVTELEKIVLRELTRSLEQYVLARGPGEPCVEAGRFGPRRVYRAPELDDVGRRTVVVLPFVNETSRRGAPDLLLGQFVAQLASSGSFDVLDPGAVRAELLAHRVVLQGGVSVDAAMALLELLNADLVVSGNIQAYEAPTIGQAPPRVAFTSYVLDGHSSQLIWSAESDGAGDDGVFFFGAGRVYTATGLACRMVRGVVDGMSGERVAISAQRTEPAAKVALRRIPAHFQRSSAGAR